MYGAAFVNTAHDKVPNALSPGAPQSNISARVLCVSWCAKLEFRVRRSAIWDQSPVSFRTKSSTHTAGRVLTGAVRSFWLVPAHPTGVEWKAGVEYEVAWTIQANHGGGYSYRCDRPTWPPRHCPSATSRPWACGAIQKGTRVLNSLWDSIMP